MSNVRQRKKALQDLAMYFAEKGKVLSQQEYIDSPDKPVPFSGIRRVFRSYSRAVAMLERAEPELAKMSLKPPPELPKVVVEKPKIEIPKPQPVKIEVPKPVKIEVPKAEPAKAEVKEDGKNI